jgi:IS30 family transposase
VSALSIVKHFDVVKDISSGEIACFVDTFSYTFFFQATKERLGNRIAPQGQASRSQQFPRELYKSLTWDRGKELADHERFSLATDIKVYFCDPQSPWQRGSNENTNGLLRQYFLKGMDLSNVHQNLLNAIARRLNERPRETLQFYSPAEKFSECVASTG